MIAIGLFRLLRSSIKNNFIVEKNNYSIRLKNIESIHLCLRRSESSNAKLVQRQDEQRARDYFKKHQLTERTRENFLDTIHQYRATDKYLRGHVEFIYAALKVMELYGVHKDLEAYKELIDIMPKEKMVATNIYQAGFFHYPKHQYCIRDLLVQMELYAVMPDTEIRDMIICIFGIDCLPMNKFARMFYWMPKIKNLSPWRLPDVLPRDTKELAILAIKRISSTDPSSKITIFETNTLEEATDDTWIVSAISPKQSEIMTIIPKDEPIKIEGPFAVHLRAEIVYYFVLRADPLPLPPDISLEELDDVSNLPLWLCGEKRPLTIHDRSVHEQDDGVILSLCATGTSSRNSLLSWMRFLEKDNPVLGEIPVLFTQRSPIGEVVDFENPKLIEESKKQIEK